MTAGGWVKHAIRRVAGERAYSGLRRMRRWLRRSAERVVFGGEARERVLVSLLGSHYRSRFRRDWLYSPSPPHFSTHRMGWFRLGFEEDDGGGAVYGRAFYSSEAINTGDVVLDIGCGDGFITKRFLAERAAIVDAIDIEPSAIREARRWNAKPNVRYMELDATNQPFPRSRYDVIVWDGALGHFEPDSTSSMLMKIADGLGPEGLFVGSESLGPEGADHLQHWESLSELRSLLERFFRHVELKERSIVIGRQGHEYLRREAYWRCTKAPERLRDLHWQEADPSRS